MADLPSTNLPVYDKNSELQPFASDEARQEYILRLYNRWKHYQYTKWPSALSLKPYDLDYFPKSPIFAVYITDEQKEHWARFYIVNEKEFLIIDLFGDLRKFPADWFPTAEVTADEIQSWLKRRFEHDR